MAIELYKSYTQKELSEALEIDDRTFKRHKDDILAYLYGFYGYNYTKKGTSIIYWFYQQYEEYIPFKHERKNSSEKMVNYYKKLINDEILKNPVFTSNSLSSDLYFKISLDINHSMRTARSYISNILKDNNYTYDKVWAKRV